MKKLLFIIFLLIFPIVSAAQTYFERPDSIIVVCNDTSSLSNYEQAVYDYLKYAGANVFKVDTSKLDSATAYGTANWDDFRCAIIPYGTGSANIDTSITHGVGDIPILIGDAYYWKYFGLEDSSGTFTIAYDTLLVVNDNSHFITSI